MKKFRRRSGVLGLYLCPDSAGFAKARRRYFTQSRRPGTIKLEIHNMGEFLLPGGFMSIVNALFVAAGFLFLALGIVGIALPVLPTTPFLLLASVCFLKGSKRLHRWIMTNKHFGPRIKRITELGLTRREKISIYVLVLVMLTPVFIFSKSLHLRIFLAALMVVKGIVFLRIKTAPRPVPENAGDPGAAFPPGSGDSQGSGENRAC